MAINKIQKWRIQLNGIKKPLKDATQDEKDKHVSVHMSKSFNSVIQDISSVYPELIDALPKTSKPMRGMPIADIKYIDLEIYSDIILNLLDLLESES